METKELKIQIPEGYEIDKEKSTFEKIVFKKKEDTKPRSWEEYWKQYITAFTKCYYIDGAGVIQPTGCYKNTLPSKELAEAFRAMMQLMSLRYDWIHKWSVDSGMTDDWVPKWDGEVYHCIVIYDSKYSVEQFSRCRHTLAFPTKEMAVDFMNCFKDLLEIAKPLI